MNKLEYYRMKLRLASPLAIGSGEDNNTDSDVILDSRGKPVIPATSIAGAVRSFLGVGYDSKSILFGYINGTDSSESKVKFYDAVLASDSFITVRDGVKLENKVAQKNAKFDKEAVETDALFETLIELKNTTEDETNSILDAVSAIDSGLLRIGSKTTRGYGQFEIIEIKKASFCLPDDRKKWVDFSPYDYSSDKYYTDITQELKNRRQNTEYTRIKLDLKQCGAVSIRSYTVKNKDDILSADFVQLSTNDGVPVIPGTSWAGAFRQRFLEFSGNDKVFVNKVWGHVDTDKNTQSRSKIVFSESRLTDYADKIITRNAIDRFSAGTKEGALYSEKTFYNGKC
ncbi:MAG: RAMP superfamily CRISPR-associated protein, partial [Ruminococcus sp.]